jgi:hypothetical protein
MKKMNLNLFALPDGRKYVGWAKAKKARAAEPNAFPGVNDLGPCRRAERAG